MNCVTDSKLCSVANVAFIAAIGFFFLISCSHPESPGLRSVVSSVPINDSTSACIDVYGRVLGDVVPNSSAYLYRTGSVEYDEVMNEVQGGNFTFTFEVNESQEFMIFCLGAGDYAVMIPTSSYNQSVGYPLPYETCTENLSIDIAFQGGNYLYAVGVFSVLEKNQNSRCENFPLNNSRAGVDSGNNISRHS